MRAESLLDVFANFLLAVLVLSVVAMRKVGIEPIEEAPVETCATGRGAEPWATLKDAVVFASAVPSVPGGSFDVVERRTGYATIPAGVLAPTLSFLDEFKGRHVVTILEGACSVAHYECDAAGFSPAATVGSAFAACVATP